MTSQEPSQEGEPIAEISTGEGTADQPAPAARQEPCSATEPPSPEPVEETELPDDFQRTRWSLVMRARGDAEAEARAALDEICRIYWYPIYAYVRRRVPTPEDAEDLTQAYFQSLLERDYLGKASKEKGKLRAFLITDLGLFMKGEYRRAHAMKRGGGAFFVPLDVPGAEDRLSLEAIDADDPAEAFDRRWALALLARVLEAVREDYRAKGRDELFEALRPYLSWNSGGDSYAEVAARLAPGADGAPRSVDYVKKNVERLRRRYRELLEKEVAQTVDGPEELAEEIRHLASAIL